MGAPHTFTMRGAQPTTLLVGIGIATVVEGLALHLLLAPLRPTLAYALEALGIITFVWLWRLFGSLSRGTVTLADGVIAIDAGRLAQARIPRAHVLRVEQAHWKDLPEKGTPSAAGYVNATAPAEPTVLLTLREPVPIRIMGLMTKSATRVAVFVDQTHDLLSACRDP